LESSSSCSYDALVIFDGEDREAPLLDELCGSQGTPIVYTSTGNVLYVAFTADESETYKGFSATFTVSLIEE